MKAYFGSMGSYRELLKEMRRKEGSFVEKELLLGKAEERLREEARLNEGLRREGLAEIGELVGLMRIQKQVKLFYERRREGEGEGGWGSRLAGSLGVGGEGEGREEEIGVILERYVFDYEMLAQLVADTRDPLLDIALANYYIPDQVAGKIAQLV